MSRTATATPPPQPYFPQRNSTPTMRHASSTTNHYVHAHAHVQNQNQNQKNTRRKTKNLPSSSSASSPVSGVSTPVVQSKKSFVQGMGLGLDLDDVILDHPNVDVPSHIPEVDTTATAAEKTLDNQTIFHSVEELGGGGSIGSPNLTTSMSDVQIAVPPNLSTRYQQTSSSLPSPESSMEFVPSAISAKESGSSLDPPSTDSNLATPVQAVTMANPSTGTLVSTSPSSPVPVTAGNGGNVVTRSWVPSFGKVAKAMVSGGVFGMGERKSKSPSGVEAGSKSSMTSMLTTQSQSSSVVQASSQMPSVAAITTGQEEESRDRSQQCSSTVVVDAGSEGRPLPPGILPPHSVRSHLATSASISTYGSKVQSAGNVVGANVNGHGHGHGRGHGHENGNLTTDTNSGKSMSEFERAKLADYRRVHECARLCSQWPQSVYNVTKYGPNGRSCSFLFPSTMPTASRCLLRSYSNFWTRQKKLTHEHTNFIPQDVPVSTNLNHGPTLPT